MTFGNRIKILLFVSYSLAEFASFDDYCVKCVNAIETSNCSCGTMKTAYDFHIICDGDSVDNKFPTIIRNIPACRNISIQNPTPISDQLLTITVQYFTFAEIPSNILNFTFNSLVYLKIVNNLHLTNVDPFAFAGVDAPVVEFSMYKMNLELFPYDLINNINFATEVPVSITVGYSPFNILNGTMIDGICSKLSNFSLIVVEGNIGKIPHGTFVNVEILK